MLSVRLTSSSSARGRLVRVAPALAPPLLSQRDGDSYDGRDKYVLTFLDLTLVVFSKSYCPYCKATKSTLKGLATDFEVVELDQICT
jgi:thiol-disulfide isomerase/thioredoxin